MLALRSQQNLAISRICNQSSPKAGRAVQSMFYAVESRAAYGSNKQMVYQKKHQLLPSMASVTENQMYKSASAFGMSPVLLGQNCPA